MGKNICFLLALFFLMAIGHQVQGSIIEYNLKGTFTSSGNGDPFGVGSGSASINIKFDVDTAQNPYYIYKAQPDHIYATYYATNQSITLSGTKVDGTYYPQLTGFAYQLDNHFSFSLVKNDYIDYGLLNMNIPNYNYKLSCGFALPNSFWDDNKTPAPKLVNQNNTINHSPWFPFISIHNGTSPQTDYFYSIKDPSISSRVVSNIYGLFIGVESYKFGEPLYRADTGATELGNQVSQLTKNISYLRLDENNSDNKNKVIEAINNIKDKIKPGDTFILYLGGHGGTFKPENNGPETTISAGNEFFSTTSTINGTISDNELYSYLKGDKFDSINKWVIIDACHAGGFWGNNNPTDNGDLEKLKNIALLAASGEDKTTQFAGLYDYGIFTHGLIEAFKKDKNGNLNADINKDGTLTFAELNLYMNSYWPETEAFKNYKGKILYEAEFGDEVLFTQDMWNPQLFTSNNFIDGGIQVVPIPSTVGLLGPILIGLIGYRQINIRRRA